ncbi:hypothetical protein ABPG74_000882 [Tetrahymena malaccensis]
MNLASSLNQQQDDNANFLDVELSEEQINNLGLDVPSNTTSLSNFVREEVQQKFYPKSLPILVKSVKECVQSLKKYYDAPQATKEDAKQILKDELIQICSQTILGLPKYEAATTAAIGGVGALIGFLIPPVGLVTGGIIGVVIGCIACLTCNKQINDFFVGPRSDQIIQAEKDLGLDNMEYTLEDLEEIYKNERPIYHPDKYRTIQQKKIFTKRYIKITESYETLKLLKKWN